ncbi:MAG: RNA polymerase sigma factor [Flammeovirgaceae bacterium]|nr:RNA polymerase sigma factor [Flammeovirgaceae bacterium]
MPDQTEILILKAKKGDTIAFNKLVGGWYKRIYNFGYKYFSDHDQAMDITQKTFIAIHKNLVRLESPQKFKGWLYKIALNYCREEDRKQKKKWILPFVNFKTEKEEFVFNAYESDLDDPEKSFQKGELAELMAKALGKLNSDQRAVIIMKEYECLKFKEIAEVLNISENTVKSRLYYGLKSLKAILNKWNIKHQCYYF